MSQAALVCRTHTGLSLTSRQAVHTLSNGSSLLFFQSWLHPPLDNDEKVRDPPTLGRLFSSTFRSAFGAKGIGSSIGTDTDASIGITLLEMLILNVNSEAGNSYIECKCQLDGNGNPGISVTGCEWWQSGNVYNIDGVISYGQFY